MTRLFILFLVFGIYSCKNNDKFIRHSSGMEYKIISYGQSDLIRPGETLKLNIKQVYNDSVLSDTRDSIPFYQVYDSTSLSPESWEVFGKLRKGDSVIFKVLSDSAFKNKWPPFAKKNQYLYTHLKVEDIFGVKEDFRDDLHKEIDRKRAAMRGGNFRE